MYEIKNSLHFFCLFLMQFLKVFETGHRKVEVYASLNHSDGYILVLHLFLSK